jgi:hypothetical protein
LRFLAAEYIDVMNADMILHRVTSEECLPHIENSPGNVQDWSPHMSFILKGSQISAFQLKGRIKFKTSIQEYRNEIQNSY